MPRYELFTPIALIAVLFCANVASVRAQQPDATKFDQTVAKARADCAALWADHALDPLRDKVALGVNPTLPMFTDHERLRARDKPVVDLVIKTLQRCRAAYAPVLAMLPPAANTMIQGLELKQDASIAELNSGNITFGDYNVAMDRLRQALSLIPQSAQVPSAPAEAVKQSAKVSESGIPSPSKQSTPAPSASSEMRVALVIGDSNYSNLPKLANPANDARAIAELLGKIGFTVRLVTDASEADLRREVRKFASESAKADIAFVFYAGHGAQVSGENYVLPVDMAIPQTEADIALTGLKGDDLVNSISALIRESS